MGETCFLNLSSGQVESTGISFTDHFCQQMRKQIPKKVKRLAQISRLEAGLRRKLGFLTPCLSFTVLLVVP